MEGRVSQNIDIGLSFPKDLGLKEQNLCAIHPAMLFPDPLNLSYFEDRKGSPRLFWFIYIDVADRYMYLK